MRAREVVVLLAGFCLGAGATLLYFDREAKRGAPATVATEAMQGRRNAGPESPGGPGTGPSATPGEAAPPSDPARGPKALELDALGLELKVADMLLGSATGQPLEKVEGLPLHPFATMSDEELASLRAQAERDAQPLLEAWRGARPGEERARAMKALISPLRHLLETGGSMENLLLLEESAERGETREERRWAVIATHTLWHAPVVDFLETRSKSQHQEVRFYAVEGLAWVRGSEQARALDGVVRGLDDPDPGVRGIAAVSLGVIAGDPARADAILERLGRETDPGAARSMAVAVLELDRSVGKERLALAAASAPAEVKAAVEKAIAGAK